MTWNYHVKSINDTTERFVGVSTVDNRVDTGIGFRGRRRPGFRYKNNEKSEFPIRDTRKDKRFCRRDYVEKRSESKILQSFMCYLQIYI